RIGPELKACSLGPICLPTFEMEHRSRAGRGPQGLAFPAGVWIIDAPIDVLREKSAGIRNAESDELSVNQREDRVAQITHRDWDVAAEAECIESVDPGVVARFGTSV